MPEFGLAATRWAARAFSILVVGAFLYLLEGEFIDPHSGPPTTFREWAGIVLFITSIASLVVAWRWELPGAAASIATLIAFVFVVRMTRYDVVVMAAIPGALFLLDWILRHGGVGHQAAQ